MSAKKGVARAWNTGSPERQSRQKVGRTVIVMACLRVLVGVVFKGMFRGEGLYGRLPGYTFKRQVSTTGVVARVKAVFSYIASQGWEMSRNNLKESIGFSKNIKESGRLIMGA